MVNIVHLNGSLVPRSAARISIADHAFLYGYGLFETMRAYHGRIFLLERHLKRLLGAAEIIGLAHKLVGIDLAQACLDTLAANKLENARLRLTVTNGENTALPWIDAGGRPTVLVTTVPYTPPLPRKYEEGFTAGLASVRRSRWSVLSGLKSVNYLSNVMARMEAAANGWDEAIVLNDEGYVAEGGSSNIIFVRESKLVTPALNSGIIPGVTREVVIELAGSLDIGVSEGPVGIGAFRRCEEAFLTGAMMELMPLVTVGDKAGGRIIIGDGKPGAVTRRLMGAYKERVEKETKTRGE